jgi:hypothetical protein
MSDNKKQKYEVGKEYVYTETPFKYLVEVIHAWEEPHFSFGGTSNGVWNCLKLKIKKILYGPTNTIGDTFVSRYSAGSKHGNRAWYMEEPHD